MSAITLSILAVSPIELTILMPCLNETQTLGKCIAKAQRFIARSRISAEILVADNGSTDGSQQIARAAGARVLDVSQRGYGAALYHGSLSAQGQFIIIADSDDSYDLNALEPFVEKLRDGCDLVIGNRFAGGVSPGAMPWKNRYLGNPVLSFLGRLLFRSPVRDFHCGIRGFSRSAFDQMDLRTTGMEFASEMIIAATLKRMRVDEVPTTLFPDGRDRPPHLRPWRDGWRHLRFMFLYSPRWLYLAPGLLMMLSGFLVGLGILTGARHLGRVVFDVHSLMYAVALFEIGFQAVLFAAMAKVFAMNEGLLPRDRLFDKLFEFATLEAGLALGAIWLLTGIAGSLYAVWIWGSHGFGNLDNVNRTLRVVITSVWCVTCGAETVMASFFFSILGLKTRSVVKQKLL